MVNRNRLFGLICALLTLLPAAVLGGRYVPVLDDYIMYQGYYLYDISYLLGTVRVWTARPVANLLDVFVWSRFHDCLFVLFLLFALLRLAAVYFLCRFFDQQGWEGAKMPLCLLLLWCPIGVEATGWLAASSRIVVGLFFLGLALWFLIHNRWVWFSLFLLLSYGCYEQIALVGCCLAMYDIWHRDKKFLWIPPVFGGLLGAYYLFCSRWSTVPRDALDVSQWMVTLQRIWDGWRLGITGLIPESFCRGWEMLARNWWLAVGIFGLTAALVWLWRPERSRNKSGWVGLLLFAVCFFPFFILKDNGISFRVLYLSLIGLSLCFRGGTAVILRKLLCGALIVVFSVGTVGELMDYQKAGQKDVEILHHIAQQVQGDQVTVEDLGLYHHTPSVLFGQHILSVTHSEWSLTAGLRAVTKNKNLNAEIRK